MNPGDLIVGDIDGVVCVPQAVAAEVLALAQSIDSRELEQAKLIIQSGSLREGWRNTAESNLLCRHQPIWPMASLDYHMENVMKQFDILSFGEPLLNSISFPQSILSSIISADLAVIHRISPLARRDKALKLLC